MNKSDILDLGRAYWKSRILFAGVELGIFDCLARGERTIAETADKLRLDLRGARILLRALCGLGLLTVRNGRFSLAPGAAPLLTSDSPQSLHHILLHWREMWGPWEKLDQAARLGFPTAQRDAAPDESRRAYFKDFIRGMAEFARPHAELLAQKLDLTGVERVLDVGGGHGLHSIELAKAKPTLRATVLDQPLPLEIAREFIAESRLEDRVETRAGDALRGELEAGQDLILVFGVLHSFGPQDCARLVNKAARALNPGGRLCLSEFTLNDDGAGPPLPAIFAVEMLVNSEGGGTYTAAEMRDWMAGAGLSEIQMRDWLGDVTLFIGRKPAV